MFTRAAQRWLAHDRPSPARTGCYPGINLSAAYRNEGCNIDHSEVAELGDERLLSRLKKAEAGSRSPNVGDVMPSFVLPDENGRLVSLEQLLDQGKAVVAFHRGHWCPYCRINADALSKIGQPVVIKPGVYRCNRRIKSEVQASYPLLTDLDCGYALDLQLAIKINDEKRSAMTSAGWDFSPFQDDDNWIVPIPANFVAGRDGLVKARFVDHDYRKRMDIDELLKAHAI